MSYIRPLENESCLYIYPEYGQIRFMSFPNHSNEVIPDEMLDILLARMPHTEMVRRKEHGNMLLRALDNLDYDFFKKYKAFQNEGGENCEND